MMTNPLSSKNSSRVLLRQRLQQHRPDLDPTVEQKLTLNLENFLSTQSGCWSGFQPLAGEPQWTSILTKSLPVDWAFPKVVGDELQFIRSPEEFKAGAFQISEPVGGEIVSVDELQGCLVPGLGFSKSGQRLGRGRGYYDRALADFKGVKVGVCFSIQFLESDLPFEAHDVKMHHVVTEKGVFDVH